MSTEKERTAELVEDSDWTVAPWGKPGHFVVGYVDEVNGRGAVAVPEFTATRYELLVLLKHWAEVGIHIRLWWFLYEQVGSSDMRQQAFAAKRVNRIADALADEESVRAAIDEVYEPYRKLFDGLGWKIFTGKASPEEERQFRQKQDQGLGGDPGAMEGKV